MTSVTVLTIASFAIVTHGMEHITLSVYTGDNYTLRGPHDLLPVSWYWYENHENIVRLCEGMKHNNIQTIQYDCHYYDLTLINITKRYAGFYYGTDYIDQRDKYYTIQVLNPTTKASTTSYSSNNAMAHFLLQHAFNTSNSTISPTLPNENNIPNSMIGIIAVVAVGMAIIVISMITYACCYRKLQHNKLDPLLSFDV